MSKSQKTNLKQPVPFSHHIGPQDLEPERIFTCICTVHSETFRQGLFLPVVTLVHLTVSNTDQKKGKRNGETGEYLFSKKPYAGNLDNL